MNNQQVVDLDELDEMVSEGMSEIEEKLKAKPAVAKKETVLDKLEALTDQQIREMAVRLGRPYLTVVRELESMKKRALYYRSDKAKAAAKRYREVQKSRQQALKALLG